MFVDAVSMPRKQLNHHSKAEAISALKVYSDLLQNYFSHAEIKILTLQKIFETSEGCPSLGHYSHQKVKKYMKSKVKPQKKFFLSGQSTKAFTLPPSA